MSEYNALPVGSTVGSHYCIREILGQGGIGRTYLVDDTHKFGAFMTLKEFAPKIREPDTEAFAKARNLFEREARILNDLHHPQIPKFHGYFEEDGRLFLVQDYIQGKNYRDVLVEQAPFSELEALRFLQGVLEVLDYVHRQKKTIHRDISPENIMRQDGSGQIFLIDFGIGKQLESSLEQGNPSSYQISLVGKPSYCPPEQMATGVCSASSDLYALAVTTIELLTGYPSRNPNTWQQSLPAPITPEFAAILTKMLALHEADRYPSAQSVLAVLAEIPQTTSQYHQPGDSPTLIEAESHPSNPHPAETTVISEQSPKTFTSPASPKPPQLAKNPWILVSLLILGMALLFGGLQLFLTEDSDPDPDQSPSPSPSSIDSPLPPPPTTDPNPSAAPTPTPPPAAPPPSSTPLPPSTPLPTSPPTLPPNTPSPNTPPPRTPPPNTPPP